MQVMDDEEELGPDDLLLLVRPLWPVPAQGAPIGPRNPEHHGLDICTNASWMNIAVMFLVLSWLLH